MSQEPGTTLIVGGVGGPHDRLATAALVARGHAAVTLAPLDGDSLQRGRAALPRGQCAPALYTTGALLRGAAAVGSGQRLAFLNLGSCGPCRYSMFASGWKRALDHAGMGGLEIVSLSQRAADHAVGTSPDDAQAMLETLAVADVIDVAYRRLLPRVVDPAALGRLVAIATERVAGRMERGDAPLRALAAERDWHRDCPLAPARALGRMALLGDPWSLHAHGDGQLCLPERFARIGVEVEVPPASLWLSYLLWQAREPDWKTGESPSSEASDRASALDRSLRALLGCAADVAGVGGVELPDMDELAQLATPFFPPSLRGGYGHVEIGLAARALRDRRCHAVVSVKSFGCIPSGAVADAIVPAVLEGRLPFLALEVAEHGDAAQDSRLTMRAAEVLAEAEAELADACRATRIDGHAAAQHARPALAGKHEVGRRVYACTLACDVVERSGP